MGRIVLPVRCIHLSPQNLQMRYTLQGRINATSQATLRMGDHPIWSVGGPDVISEVLGSGEVAVERIPASEERLSMEHCCC